MELWELLVPATRTIASLVPGGESRGGSVWTTIPKEFHQLWDAKVRAISGGLTIMPTSKGQWVSPEGTVFHEQMIPVRVACDRWQLSQILQVTFEHYRQQAIMYYRVSDDCVIMSRDEFDAAMAAPGPEASGIEALLSLIMRWFRRK